MGTLYIVSTPIGNLEDITIRAIKTLFSVDYIACEDTRRTGLLLQEIKKRYSLVLQELQNKTIQQFIRYDDQTENQKAPEIIELLKQGKSIALVSDAGTPLVSDPGYTLVRECLKRSIPVVSIPGASALLAALTTSGLPSDSFLFLGFPPEKQSHRMKLFESLLHLNRFKCVSTYAMYCAPHKLTQTLEDMETVFGNREITIARELTKIHEEIWKGTLHHARETFTNPKGEFVLLFTINEY